MNLAKINACGAKVRIMDLGGQIKMRPLWDRYYQDINAITFVIDVSPNCSVSKLMEARAFYRCMRDEEILNQVPILIFANKMDMRREVDINGVDGTMKNGEDSDESQHEHANSDSNEDTGEIQQEQDQSMILGDTSLLDIAELFLSHPKAGGSKRDLLSKLDHVNMDENVAFFVGSAKTGEGVKVAFDWLIRKGSERVRQIQRGSG